MIMLWFFLLKPQEESCEDCSTDAVPGTRDGARQYGQGLGGEEVACEDGGKTGVLHAHLDGDGTLLGFVEACQPTCDVSEDIA